MRPSTVAGALLMLAGAVVQGAAGAQAEKDVLATEDARFAAMIAADTAALTRLLGDDLTYVHSTGRVESKGEYLKAVSSGSLKYLAFAPVERRVTFVGTAAAVVMGRASARVVLSGQEQGLDLRYVAVYGQAAGGWQLRAWQTTRIPPPPAPAP